MKQSNKYNFPIEGTSYQLLLTPKQYSALHTEERTSFAQLCKMIGVSSHDREAILFDIIVKEYEKEVAYCTDYAPSVAASLRDRFAPLIEKGDFWELFRMSVAQYRDDVVAELSKQSSSLPINYPYLRRLATQLDFVVPELNNIHGLKELLSSWPWISLFDMNLNAFAQRSRQGPLAGIPILCVYEQLFVSIRAFAEVFTRVVLTDPITPAALSTVRSVANNPEFMRVCADSLSIVFCKSPELRLSPEYPGLSKWTEYGGSLQGLVSVGGTFFVWFHEYGHVLRGHFDISHSLELEHEADDFAARTLAGFMSSASAPDRFFANWGVVVVFVIIAIVEASQGKETSHTHPPALDRMKRTIRTLDRDSSRLTQLAQSLIAACNPTLSRYWGCVVDW